MMASSFIKKINEKEIEEILNKKTLKETEKALLKIVSEKKLHGLTQVFIKDISRFIFKKFDISHLERANHDKVYILNIVSAPDYPPRLGNLIREKLNFNSLNFANKNVMMDFIYNLHLFGDRLNYDNENLLLDLFTLRSKTQGGELNPENLMSDSELINSSNIELIKKVFERNYAETIIAANSDDIDTPLDVPFFFNDTIPDYLQQFFAEAVRGIQAFELKTDIPDKNDDSFLLENNLVKCGEEIYDMELFEEFLPIEEMITFKYPLGGKMQVFQMPKKEYEKKILGKKSQNKEENCCQICMNHKSETNCGNKCSGEICLKCYYSCGVKNDKCSFCRKSIIPLSLRQ